MKNVNVSTQNIATLVAAFVFIISMLNIANFWVLLIWGIISVVMAMILRISVNPKDFEENPIVHTLLSLFIGPMGWAILAVTTFNLFKSKM